MEKLKQQNVLELTKIHKDTVYKLQELQERYQKIDPNIAIIISNLLESFLNGSMQSTEVLRRARLIRDSLENPIK